MRRTNPVVIPRNHVVEQVLDAATHQRDLGPFQNMLAVLQQPYTTATIPEIYRMPMLDGDSEYRTFCGT